MGCLILKPGDVPFDTLVFVDGKNISHVTEVCPFEGKVISMRLGSDGHPVVDRSGKDFIKDTHVGQVTMVFPEPGEP